MGKKILIAVLALGIFFGAANVYAENGNYNAGSKLGRGLANCATGWVEFPKQIYLVAKEKDPLTGLLFGAVKGTCDAVLRTAGGVYDLSTFLLPPYDDLLVEPEFVFEGWE